MQEMIFQSPSEACTFDLGFKIGGELKAGDILTLWGDLGAGKTALARGIARGLGVPAAIPITSPTFTFINEYDGRLHLYHIDLYRLSDIDELETLPWREALFGTGVSVIEWPERLGRLLPDERWDIRISITGEDGRELTVAGFGERNTKRQEEWARELKSTTTSNPTCS
jgi:tRNA threonylcarbamoyladenosine biosynthesis protein TsaE